MNLDQEDLYKDQNSTEKIVNFTFSEAKNKENLKMIEVAAGIGRNIKNIFYKYFSHIDAVEPIDNYAQELEILKEKFPQIKNIYTKKAQEFEFQHKYDLIFHEGLIDTLTDIELLNFLIKVRNALNDNGVFLVKENTPPQLRFEKIENFYIEETNQKIRVLEVNLLLFRLAGFRPILIKPIYGYYDDDLMKRIPMFEYLLEKED